jgi:hypothetical protein
MSFRRLGYFIRSLCPPSDAAVASGPAQLPSGMAPLTLSNMRRKNLPQSAMPMILFSYRRE